MPQKDGEKPYGSFTIPDQKLLCWKYKEEEEANSIDVFYFTDRKEMYSLRQSGLTEKATTYNSYLYKFALCYIMCYILRGEKHADGACV